MSALSDALKAANDQPGRGWSSREIARRSGTSIHPATAANVMRGKHAANPSDEVLQAFSNVFPELTLPKLRELAGKPAGEAEPYRPPAEADRMNERQRKAVDELIRAMVSVDVPMDHRDYNEWLKYGPPRGIGRADWMARRDMVLADISADDYELAADEQDVSIDREAEETAGNEFG